MPISELGMAGAQAGMDVVGSAIGGWINKGNSKSLMRYQNQLAIQNWKMENAYNHPAAQMARLREAGLNPSLFYSSGQGTNTASDLGSPTPSNAGAVDMSGIGSSASATYLSSKMQKQQLENMQNQNELTKAEVRVKLIDALEKEARKPFLTKAARYWIDAQFLDNQYKDSLVKKTESEVTNLDQVTQNLYATLDEIKARTKNIDQDTAAKKIYAACQEALNDAQVRYTNKQIEYLVEDIKKVSMSNGMLELSSQALKDLAEMLPKSTNPLTFFNQLVTTYLMSQFGK